VGIGYNFIPYTTYNQPSFFSLQIVGVTFLGGITAVPFCLRLHVEQQLHPHVAGVIEAANHLLQNRII